MSSGDELATRNRALAQRFLQTAVVVDDEAHMALDGHDGPKAEVVEPGRNARSSSQVKQNPAHHGVSHALDAGSLIGSFSGLGIICGVVSPTDEVRETMRQADIVILDWRLQEDEPDFTLKLLRDLLTGEADRNSLRLVAIYTGEPGLADIGAKIRAELERLELEPEENEANTEIRYRHGRVVLYAKSDVKLKDRSVAEENLPERLIGDFASMTEGLLPGIALTSLTAVREGAHKVLDRFSTELDPAFLAHRACLTEPEDAQRQMVNHIAEELRGLMDNEVAENPPASADSVMAWIRRKGDEIERFAFSDRKLNVEDTIDLANKGLAASKLKDNAYEKLSAGFSGRNAVSLDKRLAWIMSFRTVYNSPAPTLWLGSVVTMRQDGKETHLICMSPRCDSVRLNGETSFIFLPLVEPQKKLRTQLVVKLGDDFQRMSVKLESASLVHLSFKPSAGRNEVVGIERESNGGFEFTDTSGECYAWQGELKSEYAQRIAQKFAETLSRPAVDESEWLRRMARK